MPEALHDLPRISVVTPSFNQGQFLEATLRSVLDQEYGGLEYVVIDGGSTDGSAEIVERYASRLAYRVSEPDHGHAHALNKGFARTTGEIMCWINSSDMYYPWTLRTVAEIFTQLPEVEWITGVASWFDITGRLRHVSGGSAPNRYDMMGKSYRMIQQESVFWRRRLWDRAGGRLDERLTCAADLDLWLRFFRTAAFCYVPVVLGGFRRHDDALGEAGAGLYEREASALHARFVGEQDKRTLARARIVQSIGSGRRASVTEWLGRRGVLPWYRHLSARFDFDRLVWKLD